MLHDEVLKHGGHWYALGQLNPFKAEPLPLLTDVALPPDCRPAPGIRQRILIPYFECETDICEDAIGEAVTCV